MKAKHWLFSVGAGGAVLAASILPSRSIDTGPLEAKFRAADPVIQLRAEKAVCAIRSADYSRALTELRQLVSERRLTPEQRRAIRNLVPRVERSGGRLIPTAPGNSEFRTAGVVTAN